MTVTGHSLDAATKLYVNISVVVTRLGYDAASTVTQLFVNSEVLNPL